MPKKAKLKKPVKRGIAVKQKQIVKQTVKVIVGDISKKPVRRRTVKPKVATLIQGTGLSGSAVPEALREAQPYSFVPDNRQPRYDFERIQPQPLENARINLLDYKANHPSVSASGLIGMQGQKALMDERIQPVIDITESVNKLEDREKRRLAGLVKRKETLAKKKADKIPPILQQSANTGSESTEVMYVPVAPKRYLGEKELERGLVKNRDEALNEKAKVFRAEQRKKRAVQAFKK